ncbi:CerR family C-terminal domain-containing protein [bacterium]|nr:CerR family C-terminal domain-containing protein [bacterium]
MTTHSNPSGGTRGRVLESACRLFAEKGYRDATVQEICEQAGANVAAVNYYFRDKESLYVEAIRHALAIASEAFPLDGGLPPGAPAEDRLRAHVAATIHRIFSDGPPSYFPHMMVKEMAEPIAGHDRLIEELLGPLRHNMVSILTELAGEGTDPKAIWLCGLSVVSQFLFFGFNKAARERVFKFGWRCEAPSMDELIEHMTSFSLAGIRAVRAAAEGGAL